MLSDPDISLAHPEAFDFVFGNLPAYAAADFTRHLAICRPCQNIVSGYSDIGRIIQDLPPHIEPPADLEDRAVAAILRAPGAEEASPADTAQPSAAEDVTATRIYQLPQRPPPAADAPATSAEESSATVTSLALWRRHRGRLTSLWVAAAAAVVILAVIVIFRPGGGPNTSGKSVVTVLHAADEAKTWHVGGATGKATARQASASWTYVLTVKGLRPLPGDQFYECWYARRSNGHLKLVSGGTFVVGQQGSTTVPMTTGVDPRDFPIMVITAESPGPSAKHGPILLTGQSHTL